MNVWEQYARIVGTFLRESVADMIRVETMEDDRTVVMKDGSMMSMIALEGALRVPDGEDLAGMVERLRIILSSYFATPGHMLEFNFSRDADGARRKLGKIIDKTERSARALGLDISDVLEERRRILGAGVVAETLLISIHTRPDALSRDEAREGEKRAAEKAAEIPVMVRACDPAKGMDLVHARHASMVDAVARSFELVGQLARVLDVPSVLREIRAALHPATAPYKDEWSPRMPEWAGARDAKAFVNMPETPLEFAARDFSHLFEPKFDRQLATEDAVILDSRAARIGDRLFSSFDMTVPPETLPDFNDLVSDVTAKSKDVPWRCSLRVEAGGMHSQALKATFLGIFAFAAPTHNRRVREAIDLLRGIDGRTDTVVKFRMSFSTWSNVSDPEGLRRNTRTLLGAVQRWGNSRADGVSGDQLATTLSTVPGATTSSTAPVAAAPLEHALAMAPIARRASPWDDGPVLFRTDDGKPWPYRPGSSKQTSWVTLLVGAPGSGKSVLMNAVNFASAISPSTAGGAEPVLPRLAMIDIGSSSSGMISLLREALPAHRRHEVAFERLRMSRDNAINVFDTQLGMREPTANERQFPINFLSLVCGGAGGPSGAMRGMISACVDRAYRDFADDRTPRRYPRGEEPDVDRSLDALGFEGTFETAWWEVADFLMENGRVHEAAAAQRHAVPTLADLVSASRAEQIASLYRDVVDAETGQPILNSFQRTVSEVVRDYPILSGHTRFPIGSARIAALDLMDVVVGGASAAAAKRTALMYMLARQILTRDFFLDEAEFGSAAARGALPEAYLGHHARRARENLRVPKMICMDEFHRTGRIEMITEQLLRDAREGRKFNIDIKIASQLIEDFPPSIIEVATGVIVCDGGSEGSLGLMDRQFRLSEGEKRVLRHELTGPTSEGAPVWAMFKLRREGAVRQKLNLTLGPAEIWAFSTTAEDVSLRDALYEILGPGLARKVLARRFPGGSAKAEIERRMARMEEAGGAPGSGRRGDVVGDLVGELKSAAYLLDGEGAIRARGPRFPPGAS